MHPREKTAYFPAEKRTCSQSYSGSFLGTGRHMPTAATKVVIEGRNLLPVRHAPEIDQPDNDGRNQRAGTSESEERAEEPDANKRSPPLDIRKRGRATALPVGRMRGG